MSNLSEQYLGRVTEHLVLEGYRQWCSGIITGDYSHWEQLRVLYALKLGQSSACLAVEALAEFTKTLGLCTRCSLQTSPVGCQFLCRDEVFVLGLIAGIQHGEETTVALCLDGLVSPSRYHEVLSVAEILATTLRALDKVLLPVPADAIKAILAKKLSSPTLH